MSCVVSQSRGLNIVKTRIRIARSLIMNIVPEGNFKSQVSTDQDKSALSSAVPSLPDTLRQQEGGAVPLSTQLNDRHPLESKLKHWETTQRQRQMEQYRQIFGIAEPMKRTMEMEIVNRTDFNPLSTSGSMHRDILLNKECSIDWEDVYPGTGLQSSTMVGNDIHSKIEKQLGI